MSIANKIKYVMGEKNKKRDDIANALKISNQAVSNKFNRDTFSADDLIKIAECLGVSLALIEDNKQIIFDLNDIKADEWYLNENELAEIAAALDVEYYGNFEIPETREIIELAYKLSKLTLPR